MFSGENIGNSGENTGENLRGVNEERGEKTIQAEAEARRRELLERRERLEKEYAELEARKREIQERMEKRKAVRAGGE